jgi:hypothetical protein
MIVRQEKRCGAPLPTALHKTFFGLRRQSKATTALFPHALTPEGENHGAFVQVLPVQNGVGSGRLDPLSALW